MKFNFKVLILVIFITSSNLWGQINSLNNFQNDREGKSAFIGKREEKKIHLWLNKWNIALAEEIFETSLKEFNPGNICAFDLTSLINAKAKGFGFDAKILFYVLRKQNYIDDVVLNTFLKNLKSQNLKLQFANSINDYNDYIELNDSAKNTFTEFQKSSKTRCIDESYRLLKAEIDKNKSASRNLPSIIIQAYNEKIINYASAQKLLRANQVKLNENYITLREYLSKKNELRNLFPINNQEKNDFINKLSRREALSPRSKLFQKYSIIQMTILASVIERLAEHLESTKIEILVYDKQGQGVINKIELEEMERFRFALKYLQKEMTLLGTNYLIGFKPSYQDIIAAAYEIGKIKSEHVETIAKLEVLWNPKKTQYEKFASLIRLTGTVGTLLIPPPYGFLVALGLVAIEMTSKKSEKLKSPDHSLF